MIKYLNHIFRRMAALCLVVLPFAVLDAQIVYQCDFEDATERAEWHLNEGPRANLCNNNWYIGAAGNLSRDGENGLFISSDGINTDYSSQYNENVVAYRELTLPEGDYVIYFSWRGKGQASSADGVWFCWIPEGVDTYTSRSLRAQFVDTYRQDTVFNDAILWQQAKVAFHSDGQPHRMAFVWTNSSSGKNVPPSGCVDDIEIIPAIDACPAPQRITKVIKGTTMIVTWQHTADWYDARVYDVNKDEWQYFDSISMARLDIDGLSEGVVEVFVRSHCGESFSEYAVYTSLFFLPGKCINYLAIDDPSQCVTYVGSATSPKTMRMLVDSGFSKIESRHTLHYVPGETDPRTQNQLLTKPADALASVRLGNWNTGAEGESIDYAYLVPDGENAILKLRYAIVLNQPSTPHSENEQSSFSLDIRYAETSGRQPRPIPYGCGTNLFHVGYGDQTGWHAVGDGTIMWREWDEVAISLRDYVGKLVVITLSTGDCTQGGHYSYAYFTLDCEGGELSGLNCGEDNPSTVITAPEGFEYEWYLPEEPSNIISRDQVFTIPEQDTMTYFVNIISLRKSQCYYTLEACGIPRYPVAKAHYKHEVINCQNVVTFYNDSYVYYHNKWREEAAKRHYTLSERPEEVVWDFGDGHKLSTTADSIVYVYPVGTMDITPTVTASIVGGKCIDSYTLETIHLDDQSIPEKNIYLPKGSFYNGKFYMEPFQFDEYTDVNGCEELNHIHIVETEFTVDTSFCEGGYYMLGNEQITQSVSNKRVTLKSTRYTDPSGNPIDSVVILNATITPQLKVQLNDRLINCADNKVFDIPYTVLQGEMDTIIVRFDEQAQQAGFNAEYGFGAYQPIHIELPEQLEIGVYNMTIDMGTPECPVPPMRVTIQNNYPSLIIDEKGPFLVVFDSAYNGGYIFTHYQWYKNGEPMEGETGSYIILNETWDTGNEYSVVVVREGEEAGMPTCPVIYQGMNGRSALDMPQEAIVYPTTVSPDGKIRINTSEPFAVYDVTGKEVQGLSVGESSFAAPQQAGVYVIYFKQQHKIVKFIVR